ncbi:MAG: DUF2797 domain-containing protein [Pseudomonadota bacterium]
MKREGVLSGLTIDYDAQSGAPANYRLAFAEGPDVSLNEHLGAGLEIRATGTVVCRHCAAVGRRSFGGGYCYDCFTTLARCDLCVMSPDRCHYHQGTCREPDWGEAFCMQPHLVYLANSSGAKVGITRAGRAAGRWLDQGAIQGLVILEADSRRAAGLAEVAIAQLLPDRTDWRKMLRSDVPDLDLLEIRSWLETQALELPSGVRWVQDSDVAALRYPFSYPEGHDGAVPDKVSLDQGPVAGNLLAMKGQYLILDSGVLNVRQHAGYRVEFSLGATLPAAGSSQLGLF